MDLNDGGYYKYHPAEADEAPWIESECCGDHFDPKQAKEIGEDLIAWAKSKGVE